MKILCAAVVILASILLSLPGQAEPDPDHGATVLAELDRKFDAETAKKGVDAWVSYFAPNGSMVMGPRPAISGREAIGKAMAPVFSQAGQSLRWTPSEARIMVPGKLGYTTGRFESRGKDKQGQAVVSRGTYVSIWQKQPDGSWKILLDTGYPDQKKKTKNKLSTEP